MELAAILTAYFKAGMWGAGMIGCVVLVGALCRGLKRGNIKRLKEELKKELSDET